MSGRICDKHNEWCPDGACRWCEPVAAAEPNAAAPDGWFFRPNSARDDDPQSCWSIRPAHCRLREPLPFRIEPNAYRLWSSTPVAKTNLIDDMNRLWAKLMRGE